MSVSNIQYQSKLYFCNKYYQMDMWWNISTDIKDEAFVMLE